MVGDSGAFIWPLQWCQDFAPEQNNSSSTGADPGGCTGALAHPLNPASHKV